MKRISFVLAACSILAGGSLFAATSAQAFDDAQKKEIETIIHDYIMDNPSIIIKAYEKHQVNEATREKEKTSALVKEHIGALTAADMPSAGASAKQADVTIVEFFDYNCGYCKRALPDLVSLIGEDKKLRVVFHEMPILSEQSHTAALWALAAHKQGKYFEYHQALMNHRGAKNEQTLSKLAEDLKLDVDKMKKDAESDTVKKELMESSKLARVLGVTGTPAFIVGEDFYGGYIGHDGLVSAIAKVRGK